jgi:GntR family transcriptional repressor for pyruvate dehydrogenase complex
MTENLSNSLSITLQKDIFNGVYPIGSRIPSERTLSATYGVSRITVRDAVRNLTQLWLLNKKPKSGTYVNNYKSEASISLLLGILQSTSHIDSDILESLLEIRKVFEVHLAGKAVARFNKDDVEHLGELIKTMESPYIDLQSLSRADVAVHELFVSRGGNLIASLVFNAIRSLYVYYVDYFYSIEGSKEILRHYKSLHDAAIRKDQDYAAFAMGKILSFAETLVRDALPKDLAGNKIDITPMMTPGI